MKHKFKMKNGEITNTTRHYLDNGGYLDMTIVDEGYGYMIKVIEYDKNGDVVGQVDEDNGIIASEVWYMKLGHIEERYDTFTDVECITLEDNVTYVADIETTVETTI